uniref:CRAL-TRIO domain-containing protein n=1 Tax=Panagrellus redivivus TaxID=6233 RepID=A0A7E4UUQ1_PANRE
MTIKNVLTDEEALKIAELRTLVKEDLTEFYDTDFNLLRWLQGHPGTVSDVAKKLRAHLRMRQSAWKLDEMKTKPRSHPIHTHWKHGITGPSKVLENVLVNIEQCGQTDYWGMIQTWSIQEVMKARVPDLEEMLRECMQIEKETGKQASVLYVMDLTGLQYNKRLYTLITGALRALSEFMAEHYVELIKYFVLVNVPSFVYAIWTVTKPILPERTRHKVRILSSTHWREEILEYACPESLPTKWNESTEEHFTATVDLPVDYPESEYYTNVKTDVKDVEKVKIAAGKNLVICRELKKGERLHWWMTGDSEFGAGVYFCKNKEEKNIENMETCYPCFEWMPSSIVPLDDEIVANEDGIYRIWVSNERAWWHTLTLLTKIAVLPPAAA